MDRELLDHAARVLQHTPTRMLDAGALYERVRRDTGIDCGVSLFLDRLQAAAHRFALLPATADFDPVGAWSEVERMAYASGLAVAGCCRWPLVTLCEAGEGEPSIRPGSDQPAAAVHGTNLTADPMGEVNRSIADLLRADAADPLLRDAVAAAAAALDTAISGMRGPSRHAHDPRVDAAAVRSTTRLRHPPPPR